MKPTKTLQETTELMLSNDEKELLQAEYYQLENRLIALNERIMQYDLTPENSSDRMNAERNILGEKMAAMRNYLQVLQREAKLKDIHL